MLFCKKAVSGHTEPVLDTESVWWKGFNLQWVMKQRIWRMWRKGTSSNCSLFSSQFKYKVQSSFFTSQKSYLPLEFKYFLNWNSLNSLFFSPFVLYVKTWYCCKDRAGMKERIMWSVIGVLFLFFVCGGWASAWRIGHQLLKFCWECPIAVWSRIGLAEKTG